MASTKTPISGPASTPSPFDPLKVLVEASATLLSSPELSSLLPRIVNLAQRMIAADAYAVWRRIEGDRWGVTASEGLSPAFQPQATTNPADRAKLPLEPFLIPDVFDFPTTTSRHEVYRAEGIRSMLVLPLLIHGSNTGSLVFYFRQSHQSSPTELSYCSALANLAAAAISTAELYEQQAQERLRFSFLADISTALASSLDYEQTLQHVADITVPALADGCNVYMVEGNRLQSVAVACADPSKYSIAEQISRDYPETLRDDVGAGKLLRLGEAAFYPVIPAELLDGFSVDPRHRDLLRQLGMRSAISVPLFARGRGIGVLRLICAESGRQFNERDLSLAKEIASRAAVAIDNALLHRELKRTGEFVALTHDAARVGSWVWDINEHTETWLSPELRRLAGFGPEWQATLETFAERIHPDDREHVISSLKTALLPGPTSFDLEYRLLHSDGQFRWLETRGRVDRDPDGRPRSVFGITIDVTQRKNVEIALKQNEERYRFVTEALPIHIWYGAQGTVEYCNRHLLDFMGLSLEEVRAGGALKLIHPDDVARIVESSKRSFSSGEPFREEYRAMAKDGEYHWLLAESRQFIDAERQLKWLGTSVDITERKLAEQDLRTSNDRLSLALDTAKMGDWEWDIRNNKVNWSAAVCIMHGIEPLAYDGTYESWLATVHPDDRNATFQAVTRAFETGNYEVEYRTIRPDGSIYWTLARGILMRSDDGRPERLLGVCMDISSRKLAEEALLRSEKLAATGRMAATIAHEINNPLEAVTNLVYLAEHHSEATPAVRNALAEADRQLHHVAHIVRQTLGFYRENAAPRLVAVRDIVNSVVDLYIRKFAAKSIHLAINVPDGLSFTVVIGEIKQVITNLVSNAIDAVPHKGNIVISARENANGIQIVVEDDGPGIVPESAERLFQPFFTTKKEVGTGLGLWVSREIAEKHGGTLAYLRSTSEQRTQFTFTLPK